MLKDTIIESENLIICALGMEKYNKERISLPKINEVFSFFHNLLEASNLGHPDQLLDLPGDLKSLKQGVFKDKDRLISCTKLNAQEFRYLTMFSGSVLNQSIIADELSGIYMCILKKTEDNKHYEPTAFSYLFRDEFFQSKSDRFIVPLLILPTTIPEELEFQWPYLALRELSINHSPTLDYRFLLQDDKEVDLCKKFNLY